MPPMPATDKEGFKQELISILKNPGTTIIFMPSVDYPHYKDKLWPKNVRVYYSPELDHYKVFFYSHTAHNKWKVELGKPEEQLTALRFEKRAFSAHWRAMRELWNTAKRLTRA
jgi:hypothetical protein